MGGITLDDAAQWRRKGWIFFDPSESATISIAHWYELVFIRNLARSGLTDDAIDHLLDELDPPYQYDPHRTAYSFTFGWVQLEATGEGVDIDTWVREQLPAWIKSRADSADFRLLTEIRDKITGAIGESVEYYRNKRRRGGPAK